ncbi:hypothetical protein GCM10007989_05000 [Devosia pacifica]|uniref:Uncharacterized protein n=1 Tax=Devosia pacifica TaxID=1335967 RepID=A0A918RY49_9HYPH|nr:hypothetical protein [Devosia pacifica]GHA13399.1 hypothetical protein GCM10007989_05000 [Devosia pacifica]
MAMIAKSGFYGGKFYKAGQSVPDGQSTEQDLPKDKPLDRMNKDELIAEAERRGVEIKASDTKADILAAIAAAEQPAS